MTGEGAGERLEPCDMEFMGTGEVMRQVLLRRPRLWPASSPAEALAERLAALPPMERQILELLVDRLEQGRREYGPWPPPAEEHRDLEREALEEAVDGLAYTAAALLRGRMGGES